MDNKMAIDMCLRDHDGRFLKLRTCMFSPLLTVIEGEAYELLQVKWVGEIEFDNVIFELDIKIVVDH
jgi:hypothetical protein